ncbi:MAG: ABC transporter permease [Parachlamydiales bacterium]|nr:ABC transporter permease [Parachlamydiales bacterium]
MKILIAIAFRNLFRQVRRSILTSLTIIIGFILLSLSIGVSLGSYHHIIEMFTAAKTGHIQIHEEDYLEKPSLYKTMPMTIDDKMQNIPFIQASSPRVFFQALVFCHNKTFGTEVIGIEPKKEFATTNIEKKLSKGTFSKEGIVIPYRLAQFLRADIGDEIALITQGADGSISNDLFRISGILGTQEDRSEYSSCYLDLKQAQNFLVLGDKIHEIVIRTDHYQKSWEYVHKIRLILQDKQLDIEPWQVVEKSFYQAMQTDIKGMWVSLAIIMLIIAIGILNTILMSLLERTREYGIMQALGTSSLFLVGQIIAEVFILTCISILIGSILAFLGNALLATYGIPLSKPITYGGMEFTSYKSMVSWETFTIPSLLIFSTALLISLFPAAKLLYKKPIESLRYV